MFPSFFHMADSMLTTSLIFSVVFFVAALVSALVGLAVRVYMAEGVRLEHARDMIGGVTGLVVTLVALVLGLLIWTAFGVFSTQKAELHGIAARGRQAQL
jgi:predicted membrane protein